MTNLQKLQAVPQPIQEWFWSDAADQAVAEIEQKFSLPESETAIPRLVFQVEVRDLPLEKLEESIRASLSLSPQTAREVYEEIKLKLFIPIAHELIKFGVGEKELAPAVPKAPAAPAALRPLQAASPLPASTPLSFAAPTAGPTPAPPSSVVVPRPSGAPVSIHMDALSSQPGVDPASSLKIGSIQSGVNSFTRPSPAVVSAPRAAQVNLGGTAPASAPSKVEAIFVERKTPLPQVIDYGAPQPAAPSPASSSPVPLVSIATNPGEAPAVPAAPPAAAPAAPPQEAAPDPGAGIVDGIMGKLFPWHSAKFRRKKMEAAADEFVGAASVDYAEAPPVPSAGTPLPVGDLPKPPAA